MKKTLVPAFAASLLFLSMAAPALAARAHAICRDHTTSYSTHRSGTCSHHKGVLTWLY
jgi:hypothetical protein